MGTHVCGLIQAFYVLFNQSKIKKIQVNTAFPALAGKEKLKIEEEVESLTAWELFGYF